MSHLELPAHPLLTPQAAPEPSQPAALPMWLPDSHNPRRDRAYYQHIHEYDQAYQTNNWLVDEIDRIGDFQAETILELACGNGRFLARAASRFRRVYACDWAISPRLTDVLAAHDNVTFFQTDLYRTAPLCEVELVVSADFLEHIAPESLADVLRRVDSLAPKAFHKVACYDDGHSHLSVLTPETWLELFQSTHPAYRLERVEHRRGNTAKTIAVLVKDGGQ